MTDFRQVFQLPLHVDEYCGVYVWTKEKKLAFNYLGDNIDLLENIVNTLNDNSKENFVCEYKDKIIYIENEPTLLVRGFGYLTGIGGLRLSIDDASKVQDDFCEWCVEKLKGKLA